ncbi:monocarboxylate transporter 9 [Folsomia candida]|nr:monocarboxylate transporter 9 [Folsomia candida]
MPCLFGKLFSMGLTYYFLVLLCGVFGLMIAANYSLTPVILLQVVSLEKFTPAYGLLLLVQGIGNLIGPPIAGLLYDYTGKYAWSFWIAGGGIFISNFFILAPIYQRHQARYEESTRTFPPVAAVDAATAVVKKDTEETAPVRRQASSKISTGKWGQGITMREKKFTNERNT